MTKPDLDFDVLEWAGPNLVLKLRVFGTAGGGGFDRIFALPEPMTIEQVHDFVRRANSGYFRS